MKKEFIYNIFYSIFLTFFLLFLYSLDKFDKNDLLNLFKNSVVPDSYFIGTILILIGLWLLTDICEIFKKLFIDFSSILRGIYLSIASFLLCNSLILIPEIKGHKDCILLLFFVLVYFLMIWMGSLIEVITNKMLLVSSIMKKISIILLVFICSCIFL